MSDYRDSFSREGDRPPGEGSSSRPDQYASQKKKIPKVKPLNEQDEDSLQLIAAEPASISPPSAPPPKPTPPPPPPSPVNLQEELRESKKIAKKVKEQAHSSLGRAGDSLEGKIEQAGDRLSYGENMTFYATEFLWLPFAFVLSAIQWLIEASKDLFELALKAVDDWKTRRENAPAKPKSQPKPAKPKAVKVTFTSLAKEQIIFLDIQGNRLGSGAPSLELFEAVAMQEALSDLANCLVYVKDMPGPSAGYYEGMTVAEVFESADSDDIMRFLRYVARYPQLFAARSLKFSEAFATWVLQKSAEDE